ncbi:MAG: HAD family hydrolase [Candidatus Bipolaricaulaceae bacterium]
MIHALLFDFDGLILDTETPALQSWLEVFRAHGCHLRPADWVTCIGGAPDMLDPVAMLEAQLGRRVDRAAVHRARSLREEQLVAAQQILPGVSEYIRHARRQGLALGVVSSSGHAWVDRHLRRLGLWTDFQLVKCSDDVPRAKPYPDLYLAALDELGITADQAVALEDSPNGVLAAKRAGLFCVAVPQGPTRGLPMAGADLVVSSLAELPLADLVEVLSGQRAGWKG